MNLTLSWDLFIIVFFAIIITYSFIVGKNTSVKIIIACYIAIIAAQGIGNLIEQFSDESTLMLGTIGVSLSISLLASTKLVLFIITVVFLAVRGGFEISYTKDSFDVIDATLIAFFGFATAGFLLSTLLTFIANKPLLDPAIAKVPSIALIMEQSKLITALVVYQEIWFALPALLLLAIGFFLPSAEENT